MNDSRHIEKTMNTLRNLAALALLAFAAISPAHAEQATEGTTMVDSGSADGSSWNDLRKMLKNRSEIAALASDGNTNVGRLRSKRSV
jgi:hypothetical protein